LGKSGSTRAHCSSDKNAFCIHSFSQNPLQSTSTKSLTVGLMKPLLALMNR
jgi:hypothetical protein